MWAVVEEFEAKCASKFDRKYGIAVSNGSVALDLALQLLDLKEGDEVQVSEDVETYIRNDYLRERRAHSREKYSY